MNGVQENQKLKSVQDANQFIGINKKCSRCKEIKPVNEFAFCKKSKDGKNCACKKCHNEECRIYKTNNPEKVKESAKKYRDNNKELTYQINKLYMENNKEKTRARHRKNMREKMKNPKHKLSHNMSDLVRYSLHGKKEGKSWKKLVGYTLDQLIKHLEKQFTEGMTWENHTINGWHVDHKIPITAFNYTLPTDIDFKKCWSLSNLQPMWAKENRKKQNKIDKPFQPSLSITI
jgi:hypothetical protein